MIQESKPTLNQKAKIWGCVAGIFLMVGMVVIGLVGAASLLSATSSTEIKYGLVMMAIGSIPIAVFFAGDWYLKDSAST